MTIIPNILAVGEAFAAGFQRLFAAVENEPALVKCVVAKSPGRNRYRASGFEYLTTSTFRYYQY